MLSVLVIFVALGLSGVSPTGIGTHIETAERAAEYLDLVSDGIDYRRLIKRHPGAFEAGQPYVDAFFPRFCQDGDLHYVSSDSHWTPFVDVTIKYIRRTYPRPWSLDTEKLVVFLLGIVEHHIADVKWHGEKTDQGFIVTMANVNYHGSFDAAHLDGDTGADVMNQYSLDMSYIGFLPTKWYVPVDDLVNIYFDYYGDGRITGEIIENCTLIMFLERLGESLGLLEFTYPFFSRRSPFLAERLQDYFQGGVDDMAVWTGNQWHETVHMLDHGTDDCYMPEVFLWARCSPQSSSNHRRKMTNEEKRIKDVRRLHMKRRLFDEESFLRNLQYLETGDILVDNSGNGITISLSDNLAGFMEGIAADDVTISSALNETDVVYPDFSYETQLPYSRVGECLVTGDFNNDGYDDLAIGAPVYSSLNNFQQGRVYIVYGGANGLPASDLILEQDADRILDGPLINGRFGHSLAAVDLNKDGITDLAVGAPSSGSETLEYQGAVFVYYGLGASGLEAEASVTVKCTDYFCNMGWSLSSGDVNNDAFHDLIIGAPFAPAGGEQRGIVGALYSVTPEPSTSTCPPLELGAIALCEEECRTDVDCVVNHKCCYNGCGHICHYTGPTDNKKDISQNELDWIVIGDQDYEWFGWDTAVNEPRTGATSVVIGSPTYRICAMQDCEYDLEDVQSVGRYTTYRVPLGGTPESIVEGTGEMGQLGFTITTGQIGLKDALVVGAISLNVSGLQNGTITEMNRGGEVGVHNSVSGSDPLYTFVSDRQHARFGSSIQISDVDGDGTNDVLVGAPLRAVNRIIGREAGHVFIFDGAIRSDQYGEEAKWKLSIDEERSRFGTATAVVKSTKTQVFASAPHSDTPARLGGRVGLFEL